jgi:hypothetical protein
MLAGLAAAGLGFLFYKRDRVLFGVSLLTLSFMLLLVRGGVVLYFYVIPLLVLLALSLGLLAGHVVPVAERWLDERISRWWTRRPQAHARPVVCALYRPWLCSVERDVRCPRVGVRGPVGHRAGVCVHRNVPR